MYALVISFYCSAACRGRAVRVYNRQSIWIALWRLGDACICILSCSVHAASQLLLHPSPSSKVILCINSYT